jgi:endonuclease III
MKNATKHAEALKSLAKKLLKEHKPAPRTVIDPLRAMVVGIFSYDAPDDAVAEAMKALDGEYCDLNELRVATELEVQDILGVKYPHVDEKTSLMKTVLGHIFEKEAVLNLERLKTLKKNELRQFYREIPDVPPFVEAYTMMFGYDQPAFPIDPLTLDWLKEHGAVEPDSTLEEAQKFVESTLKGEDCYEFYAAIRLAWPFEELKKKKKK